ncbi:MAG TPA: alanine/ornithine racemase family PLP-dependent enzyme [Candidatus Lustribacter sp.]|nr:alanine/ornithine racemase family PLP-dependent enzyme [Candidatus Lustribacter sp.]
MFIRTPRLEVFADRVAANARVVTELCRRHGVEVACVTKVMGAHPGLVHALEGASPAMIADSRIGNLQLISNTGSELPTMLLRLPTPSRVADVVRCADYSLNSSVETIELLSRAAQLQRVDHKVVLMVDVGDLREGVWPDRLVSVLRSVAHLPRVEVVGIGTNLACFGGVVPSPENMQLLVDLRTACREATDLDLAMISGGNSANLPLLASGGMPPEVNHLRIGEAITLGRNVLDRSPWPGTRQDTLRLVAEVVEVERKPSLPIGQRSQDAFGGVTTFIDRGIRTRAICNIGRQDVVADGVFPEDVGIFVLGASSDHLMLDVEDAAGPVRVGDEIGFVPSYGSLLAATTSPYVQKVLVRG